MPGWQFVQAVFLSRLYGGELVGFRSQPSVVFLSRLYGGEQDWPQVLHDGFCF